MVCLQQWSINKTDTEACPPRVSPIRKSGRTPPRLMPPPEVWDLPTVTRDGYIITTPGPGSVHEYAQDGLLPHRAPIKGLTVVRPTDLGGFPQGRTYSKVLHSDGTVGTPRSNFAKLSHGSVVGRESPGNRTLPHGLGLGLMPFLRDRPSLSDQFQTRCPGPT